jgi:ParB-like chromosome segregation protein Spo0J
MAKKEFKFEGLIKQAEIQNRQSADYVRENIEIEEEFRRLIPPLSDEESRQLEANILAEGCRDALVVWAAPDNRYVLVDGHNRYGICRKHQLPFKVQIMQFDDREAVRDWMVNNQLGKRNVTEETKAYLRGLQYSHEKRNIGGTGANQHAEKSTQERTAEKLAESYQVSERTIRNDGKFAQAIDRLAAGNDALKWQILNRQIKVNKTDLSSLHADRTDWEKLAELLQQGTEWKQAVNEAHTATPATDKPAPKTPKKAPAPDAVLQIRQQLINDFDLVRTQKDKAAFLRLQAYIEKLEELVFKA